MIPTRPTTRPTIRRFAAKLRAFSDWEPTFGSMGNTDKLDGKTGCLHGWLGKPTDKRLAFDFGSAGQLIRGIAQQSVGIIFTRLRPESALVCFPSLVQSGCSGWRLPKV
jgi:hypothetical protein